MVISVSERASCREVPMLSAKTVLVIGAGASKAFGYPTGAELRNLLLTIVKLCDNDPSLHEALAVPRLRLQEFVEQFRASQIYSIDRFLGARGDFDEIGRRCIAALLLNRESVELLLDIPDSEDVWARELWNHLQTNAWEELSFGNLGIVTFNYDRSLEHYLLRALSATYQRSMLEVQAKLDSLDILHVYGSVGSVRPGDPTYHDYGSPVSEAVVDAAVENLRITPDSRSQSDPVLSKAQQLLREAQKIGFLGFSFDDINLLRLDVRHSVKRIDDLGGRSRPDLYATTLGLPRQKRKAAWLELQPYAHVSFEERFVDVRCVDLLRDYPLLT